MRKDQIERLKDIAQEVTEVFLSEADPSNWSGAGLDLSDMDSQVRGDRYWCKKNAIQTGSLLARVIDLAERDGRSSANSKTDEEDAEKEISRYERQAKELIESVQNGGK